eukprot:UN01888
MALFFKRSARVLAAKASQVSLSPLVYTKELQSRSFAAAIGGTAPSFTATAVVNGRFETINLEDYKGKWVVLFFYPLDFTFVCPTEILEFSDRNQEFQDRKCEVLGASIDSQFTHLAWMETAKDKGGLGGNLNMPVIADLSRDISSSYGCLQSDGVTVRATYIIDDKGIVRHISLNDRAVGRSVSEILRLVDAFQYTQKYGEVCPVNWEPGNDTMKADPYEKLTYFQNQYAEKDGSDDESDDKLK